MKILLEQIQKRKIDIKNNVEDRKFFTKEELEEENYQQRIADPLYNSLIKEFDFSISRKLKVKKGLLDYFI